MPALKKTNFTGLVRFIGYVKDREDTLRSETVTTAMLTFDGFEQECHGGTTRMSCSRVTSQHPRNTQISNTRQLSVLSVEELAHIGGQIGVADIKPDLLGASLVLEGLPDLTHIPPSSRLQFPSGATLVVDMENRPCVFPAKEIEHDHEGHGKAFKAAAKGLRGVTAWVERPGQIAMDDTVTLHVPDQPAWSFLDEARRG